MTFASAAILAAAFVFKPGDWTVSDDGRSIRNPRAEGVFSFSIGETPAFDGGCVLSFEARMRKDPTIDKDGHFGFDFVNEGKAQYSFFRPPAASPLFPVPARVPVGSAQMNGRAYA